jgi:hypothetical protein
VAAQDISQAITTVFGVSNSQPPAQGEEFRLTPPTPDESNGILATVNANGIDLESRAFSVNMVATCQVRNATRRILHAYDEFIDDREVVQTEIITPENIDGDYLEVLGRTLIKSPGDEDSDRVGDEFQAAVRAELGVDPTMVEPEPWSREGDPLNEGLEDC